MSNTLQDNGSRPKPEPIGKIELRLMNSRAREWLLKYWDFPLFQHMAGRHGISLDGRRILDAGCGSGYSLTLINERFRPGELTAFDIVPSQVEIAKSRDVPATVFVADITALELPCDTFDAVFVSGVLHHCPGWRAGLAEVARVLKEGGLLFIEEPGTVHLKFERVLTGHSSSLEAGFSVPALQREMERNGLSVLDSHRLYFGLFRSFLCVKGATLQARQYHKARHLFRAPKSGALASGQESSA